MKLIQTVLSRIIIIFVVILYCVDAFSQISGKESNFWYFGAEAGIDFNTGSAVAVIDGKLWTSEGCAAISDTSGNLRFYTDGRFVYDSTHTIMSNGTGLMGHSSSTQSAIIVPQPGSDSIYYIFTIANQEDSLKNGLRYSEVDMSLNGGLGDVTANKNILLSVPVSEKITAVYNNNRTAIWVLAHEWGSNAFFAYSITNTGVNLVPIVSNVGTVHTGVDTNGINFFLPAIGYMKFSPNGKKIAVAINYIDTNAVELYDFNDATGIVSNPLYIPSTGGAYGVEFSPNSSKLYVGFECDAVYTPSCSRELLQYDLSIYDSATIIGTKTVLYSGISRVGALQLAPDSNIYVCIGFSFRSYLSVIHEPDSLGLACNFIQDDFLVHLPAATWSYANFGLPQSIQTYFSPEFPLSAFFSVSDTCIGDSTHFVNMSSGNYDSLTWHFGDPMSGASDTSYLENPAHLYSDTGMYTVTLIIVDTSTGDIDTFSRQIEIKSLPIANISNNDTLICRGQSIQLTANGGVSYSWSPSVGLNDTTIADPIASPVITTTYIVTVSDLCGVDMDSVTVVITSVTASAWPDTIICEGRNVQLNANGGANYLWSPSTGLSDTIIANPIANPLISTTYTVIVEDSTGCIDKDSVLITVDIPVVSAGPDDTITPGSSTTLNATGIGTFLWIPATGLSCMDCFNPTASPDSTITYVVKLISPNSCINFDTIIVYVIGAEIGIPSAFTPNGDGVNELFEVKGRLVNTFLLRIFNRWGELVFETQDINIGWDGTYKGKEQPMGTYVYYVRAIEYSGEETILQGNITLIR